MDEDYFKKLASDAAHDQNTETLVNIAKTIASQVAMYYNTVQRETNPSIDQDVLAQMTIDYSWLVCLAMFFKDRELPSRT